MHRVFVSTSKQVAKSTIPRTCARTSVRRVFSTQGSTPNVAADKPHVKSMVVGGALLVGTLGLGSLFCASGKQKLKESTSLEVATVEDITATLAPDGSGDSTTVTPPSSEEGPGQAAFDPETGEINWDCPCLGGMAHGPCGEQFKAAFSCFVYSDKEPKGIECVEAFSAMQDCFRAHPDVYAAHDFEDEEEDIDVAVREAELATKDSVEMAELDQPRPSTTTSSSTDLRQSESSPSTSEK